MIKGHVHLNLFHPIYSNRGIIVGTGAEETNSTARVSDWLQPCCCEKEV